MTEFLDLRQSSRLINAFNERTAERLREDPTLVDTERRTQKSFAEHNNDWLLELLRLADASGETDYPTRIELHLTNTALTCSFPTGPAFLDRLFERIEPSNSASPTGSLALLRQVSRRPQFYSSQGSLLFAPTSPEPLEPAWLDDMDFAPMTFARAIDGLFAAPEEHASTDQAKVLLSIDSEEAVHIAATIRALDPELLGLLDHAVDISFIDDTSVRPPLRLHKYRDHSGRWWVSAGPDLERPLEIHTSDDGTLTWSVLANSTSNGRLFGYLPTRTRVTIPGILQAPFSTASNDHVHQTAETETIITELAQLIRSVAKTARGQHLLAEIDVVAPTDNWADRLLRHHVGSIRQAESVPQRAHGVPTFTHSRPDAAAADVDRILALIPVQKLREGLPDGLANEMRKRRGPLDDTAIAELALAVHGIEILKNHKYDLRGHDVPHQWAGGPGAVSWVTKKGFSADYAGFRRDKRQPVTEVPGPPNLPELHDFQRRAVQEIRSLVRTGDGRGLLSLPTGAGKTRTATHAIIESLREGDLEGPVLWVAETDELCEQAVDAWSSNWRQIGPNADLKICRLWAGNEVSNLHDPHQVVVASEAKLRICLKKPEYRWLREGANAIIIDEAHRAVSPTFTSLLKHLGMDFRTERIPVIGLSATPYRNSDKDATERLVKRFGSRRFDDLGPDPYGMLQSRNILATVKHRLIDGVDIELSADEIESLQSKRVLPATVLERVGRNSGRNLAILEHLSERCAAAHDFTALLFAASVEHAALLAGMLSVEGIRSRSISGMTTKGARRHYIDQFRRGEVRVLTNYGVLTEGFDAPAVSAIYIARPIYSWNLYQQVVGRGLRGRLNGGKDECLVVNVADNLANYGEKLAYQELEHLWERQ